MLPEMLGVSQTKYSFYDNIQLHSNRQFTLVVLEAWARSMLFDDLLTVTRASVISGNNLSKNLFACGKT